MGSVMRAISGRPAIVPSPLLKANAGLQAGAARQQQQQAIEEHRAEGVGQQQRRACRKVGKDLWPVMEVIAGMPASDLSPFLEALPEPSAVAAGQQQQAFAELHEEACWRSGSWSSGCRCCSSRRRSGRRSGRSSWRSSCRSGWRNIWCSTRRSCRCSCHAVQAANVEAISAVAVRDRSRSVRSRPMPLHRSKALGRGSCGTSGRATLGRSRLVAAVSGGPHSRYMAAAEAVSAVLRHPRRAGMCAQALAACGVPHWSSGLMVRVLAQRCLVCTCRWGRRWRPMRGCKGGVALLCRLWQPIPASPRWWMGRPWHRGECMSGAGARPML